MPFVLYGLFVFFVIIALTLVLGAISWRTDRRVQLEGRASPAQRPSETPQSPWVERYRHAYHY